jgi:hypothetical protein
MDQDQIDEIYDRFDVDGVGALEKDEFIRFLEILKQEAEERVKEMMEYYFYALESSSCQRFVPPFCGILHLTVIDNFTEKGPRNILSSPQEQYMIELTTKIGDPSLVSDVIQHYKLRYSEAFAAYKVLASETGNMAEALSKVLPRMASLLEARKLLSKVAGNDASKLSRVKMVLGCAFQPLLGNINGYYSLNLSIDTDRMCLAHLLGHSKSMNAERIEKCTISPGYHCHHHEPKIGDTSQHGNWTFFRNELFNNEPFIITPAAFTPMKKSGFLEFDFSR